MNTEINNIVLTSSISETISILQDGGVNACCNTIDRATGLILDLKVDNEGCSRVCWHSIYGGLNVPQKNGSRRY